MPGLPAPISRARLAPTSVQERGHGRLARAVTAQCSLDMWMTTMSWEPPLETCLELEVREPSTAAGGEGRHWCSVLSFCVVVFEICRSVRQQPPRRLLSATADVVVEQRQTPMSLVRTRSSAGLCSRSITRYCAPCCRPVCSSCGVWVPVSVRHQPRQPRSIRPRPAFSPLSHAHLRSTLQISPLHKPDA